MDETMKLINMAHEGDKAARDQLVMDNVGLIWSIVRRFSGRGYEMEDLFQIGSIGLIKAIDKFDTGFDVKFSTYAVPMITGEIKRFLRDDGMIKVSRSIKELGVKVRAAREEMTYALGREPTIEEIAGRLGTSREEVAASLEAAAEVESLYRPADSGDETMKLINMAHEGDKAARDQLVMDNVGLIWSIVRRFSGRGYEMEDLFQIGSIGLIKAIDKFDTGFDVKFSTYAVPMITGEIKRFLRDDGMIKVSRSIKELGVKVRAAREEMTYALGREPTIEEIAGRLGTSREEVAASLEAAAEVESLYRPADSGDENSTYLMDRLAQDNNDHEDLLNRMVLKDLMEGLEEEQREIILRRYFYNETQTQIAGELGISQVQVSRLEKRILKEMRKKL